jgi:type VI secretion system protein ImpC
MPERLNFDLGFGRPGRRREDGEPMRLLVLGNFRGRGERPPLPGRPTQQVDIDSLDDVMQRLAPRLTLAVGDLQFKRIDDFHPDRLYGRLELFQALREKRARPPADGDDLLARLLGGSPQHKAPAQPASGLDALIHKVVAPHIVKDTSAQTRVFLAAVDAAIAEQMRSVLHDPGFQALEAAWRGVHWLVSNLELDENLQLHLFDVSREELLSDVVGAKGQIPETALHRALVDRWRNVPGTHGWSAFVGLFQFGPSDTDVGLLAALGLIASQAGGPLLAGAEPQLAEDDEVALAGWLALRRSEAAPWIGLAAPRILLRMPYGTRSDPVESFAFEEFDGPPIHEQLLWGHGSLALALLIGRGFTERGWAMEPGDQREIGDLPAYTFTRDGEQVMQACAERFLSEREIQALLDAGLVPVVSRRDRNAVVAVRFQSISQPPAPLPIASR